ncbi:hypothetical protein JTB14_016421 [Gonioctena quinquepunctata]|nr:hypothetical protein JTB14_016421 [Gonioctena quinquepunctata]
MRAAEDTRRSDHNQEEVSSKRLTVANNLEDKTSARESYGPSSPLENSTLVQTVMSRLRKSERLAEKAMRAAEDTRRSDHNQEEVSSKRLTVANNLEDKTSARESYGPSSPLENSTLVQTVMSRLRKSERLAEKAMQAAEDTRRSDHNQEEVSSKRLTVANNLENKTSARESLNVDNKKNNSEHGRTRYGSKVDSERSYLSSRKRKKSRWA